MAYNILSVLQNYYGINFSIILTLRSALDTMASVVPLELIDLKEDSGRKTTSILFKSMRYE